MIEVREFTTAAEVFANAAAVRARRAVLFNARRRPDNGATESHQEDDPARERPKPKIIVTYRDSIQKDAHVTAYYLMKARMESKALIYIQARCSELGITVKDVTGPSRVRSVVLPRQAIMWEIKNTIKPLISFPELGRLFGGRDHTTALHSVNSISSKIAAGVLSVDEDGKVTLPKAFA
jgi:hypothetical protein